MRDTPSRICACDVAIAARSATFAVAEVRLGLTPSVISPFVINAIGVRRAGRLFLTGERIDAIEAERIGIDVAHQHRIPPCAGQRIDRLLHHRIELLAAPGGDEETAFRTASTARRDEAVRLRR